VVLDVDFLDCASDRAAPHRQSGSGGGPTHEENEHEDRK
jgi:hypothetical protein